MYLTLVFDFNLLYMVEVISELYLNKNWRNKMQQLHLENQDRIQRMGIAH